MERSFQRTRGSAGQLKARREAFAEITPFNHLIARLLRRPLPVYSLHLTRVNRRAQPCPKPQLNFAVRPRKFKRQRDLFVRY
jgi:hypothetical protein